MTPDPARTGGEYKRRRPVFWGGPSATATIKGTPLMVNGVLYLSSVDNAWAVDARSGRELWHYTWRTTRRHPHIGNRGLGMYGNWLFMETPDCCIWSRSTPQQAEELAQANRRRQAAIFLHAGADYCRQPRADRYGRRLARCAGLAGIPRSRNRRSSVEVVHNAASPLTTRLR